VIDAPMALAFTSGLVATVNPCGFAMLPAYVSYFIGGGAEDTEDTSSNLSRALVVGAAVSSGFMVVFGIAGVLIAHFSISLYQSAPWITVVIGLALLALGIAMIMGFELSVALPKLERGTRGTGLRSMFVFGVSYAIASLSCTLPIFLGVVAGTFDRESFVSGVAVFIAYGLGMALVLMVLTVALALARHQLVHALKRSMRYVNRAAGVLLVLAGGYVAWYGIYEIRLDEPNAVGQGPVDFVTGLSTDVQTWVDDFGATRVGLLLTVIIGLVLLFVLARQETE
jgi:cytochrome c-type biogenesis protein